MRIPWNKGKKTGPQSPELRAKRGKAISEHLPRTAFQKGVPSWNKGLSNTWAIGEKNVNWKNGSTKKNYIARQSPEVKMWRCRVLVRDGFICVLCGFFPSLVADHIKSFANYPELRHVDSNGRTLCLNCHKKTDTYLNSRAKRVD